MNLAVRPANLCVLLIALAAGPAFASEPRFFHREDASAKLEALETNLTFFIETTIPEQRDREDRTALCYRSLAPLARASGEAYTALFNLEKGDLSLGQAKLSEVPGAKEHLRTLGNGADITAFDDYCTERPGSATLDQLEASARRLKDRVASLKLVVERAK